MANKVKLLRSSVVTEGQPKLPTSSQIDYGELAINYADGYETISLKNSNNEIVTFSSDKIIKNIIEEDEEIAAAAFNDLNDKINDLVEITYSELYDLREAEELKPGRMYRITDFITTTTQTDTQSAEHQFDVIVTATDVNTINENAKAIKHDGDTYFANANLDAWELKYSLDNDTTKFPWADTTNGTGVIYYMKDEQNNECPYDFKNIQFKRYQLKGKDSLYLSDYVLTDPDYDDPARKAFEDWQNNLGNGITNNNIAFYYTRGVYEDGYIVSGADIYDYSPDYESYNDGNLIFHGESSGNYIGLTYIYDYFDVIGEVTDANGEWFYTFSKKATVSTSAVDASMDGNCHGNKITKYYDGLNDNIFITLGNTIDANGNKFDINCYNNTFGNSCYYNTFGNSCFSNTFGTSCSSNTFGKGCYSNTFGDNCGNNTFGNNCGNNTFRYSCSSNTFGNSCGSNTFGNYCSSNTFGKGCYSNTFGNSCESNTFGNNFYNNTFGNNCSDNTFRNNCDSNTFGKGCYSNTFGENVNHITFSKDYMYYNIIENGNQYITITSTLTTSSSNKLMNFTIAQGVNNTSTLKTISHNSVNDAFKTTYQNLNSVIVNI